MTFNEKIEYYQSKGFKVNGVWKGEYVLLTNSNIDKVRVYENGDVWISDPKTGEYRKEKGNIHGLCNP